MMRQTLLYGDERIEYELSFVPHKADAVSIHVHPDGSVQVDAPDGEDMARIHRAVLKRARWIRRHVRDARRHHALALPRAYVSGESLPYLGRRYQLKVLDADGSDPSVRLLRGQIRVAIPSRDPKEVKEQLADWYRVRASDVFARRIAEITESVPWLNQPPAWRLVSMRKQWGSCSPSGQVLLNPHLVKAPRPCVDYVICHELCHLQEHNHSPRYYRLLNMVMPGWEPLKARLDGMAELLLNE